VDFELVNRAAGRIYADGVLPTEGVSNFRLAVNDLPAEDVLALLQSDVALAGVISLAGEMHGTTSNPSFRGRFALPEGTYRGDTLPQLRGTFAYAGQLLDAHVDAIRRGGAPMAVVDARVPINLAFTGVTGDRLIDAPMTVDVVGDSIPVDLIPHFTDALSNVHGRVAGRFAIRGPLRNPSMIGGLVITAGSMTLNSTGQRIESIRGPVRLQNDTVYLGEPAASGSEAGTITGLSRDSVMVRGTIAVGNWRNPDFDVYLVARNAEVLNNEHGKIRADVAVSFKGPLDGGYLSGGVHIRQGVIVVPEPAGKQVIGAGDPALFAVMDTSVSADRELFPERPALLRNLRMEVTVEVDRDTWVRSREANVEIYTEGPLVVRMNREALALTGVVTTDRGDYTVYSKRFQIRRGSAIFIGDAGLNPTLQFTGEYLVRAPTSSAISIRVLIGGTLMRPILSLESDVQPPKSQSELMSLLAFGQAPTDLVFEVKKLLEN
jgi:autotransporter translocation and assembly factor TamB